MKKRLCAILSAFLTTLVTGELCLPCLAVDAESGSALVDADEIDDILDSFRGAYDLTDSNFSLAYCYTGTGETYYCNEEDFMYAASMYKVPLCMAVAEKVSSGELAQTDSFAGMEINYLEEQCLINSNNEVAGSALFALGDERERRVLLAGYSGYDPDELPDIYYQDSFFSARFMLNTMLTLYNDPERFPHIIDCLLQAQPENYFRLYLEGKYDVAQKYGSWEGQVNTAGIIYTPTPFLLVVMTDHVGDGATLIGALAGALADYTRELDGRRQLAAEKAAQSAAGETAGNAEADAASQEAAREQAAAAAAQETALQASQAQAAARARTLRVSVGCGLAAATLLTVLALRQAGKHNPQHKYRRRP